MSKKIKRNSHKSMTNLDVMTSVLAQVTGRPQDRFRQVICTAIECGEMPAGKLFQECPDGEQRVEYMVKHEASGILNWAIQGGIMVF